MFEWKNLKSKKHQGYELLENDKPVATIILAEKKSSFKATLITGKEVVKIKRKGFWKSIIVFFDENEEVIARIGHEKLHFGRGVIEIKSKKYFFKYVNSPLAELILFEKEISPLISYKLIVRNKSISVDLHTSSALTKQKDKLYLLAMGWYMFQPVVKENIITKWV